MRQVKDFRDASGDLYTIFRGNFILFEEDGGFTVGMPIGFKSVGEAFDTRSIEIATNRGTLIKTLADLRNAYIMSSYELLDYIDKMSVLARQAHKKLDQIYSLLDQLKDET